MTQPDEQPFQRIKRLFLKLFPVDVIGEFPDGAGPMILVSNHNSPLDGAYLWALLQRRSFFLVTKEAFSPRYPLTAALLIWTGQIPVDQEDRYSRGNPFSGAMALRVAEDELKDGGVIGIQPEGECRDEGSMAPFELGVVRLAFATGALIVPVGIRNSGRVMSDLGRLVRPFRRARLIVGAPVSVAGLPNTPHNRRLLLRQLEETVAELSGQPAPAARGGQQVQSETSRR